MRIPISERRLKSVSLAFAFILFLPEVGQRVTSQAKSPQQVLKEFVGSDLRGDRLTEKGRSKLSTFFVQRSEPRKDEKIVVVSSEYDLRQAELSSDHAKFHIQFRQFYGKVDSVLNLQAPADTASNGVPLKGGLLSSFDVVRVRKPGATEPAGQENGAIDRETEWKLDGPQPPICISLATAKRYLSEMSTAAVDPTRRSNASRALAELSKRKGSSSRFLD